MRKYVTEELLTQCAAAAGPNSTFENFLKAGEEIKQLGLTPVYIYDDVLGTLEIATQEKLDNKLN